MNFDELLKTLHRDYLTSLPKKITAIQEQMQMGSSTDLRESFHKLKGTGRTYGMPEVSELAALVEEICSDHPKNAVTAVSHALLLLREIYDARVNGKTFDIRGDARFAEIQKLLQN